MHNDIKLIEESIKKDAKASQDRFAKAVAEEVSLSIEEGVNSVVSQLDNKVSIDNIKKKLEKIKELLESCDLSSLAERIDGFSKKIELESELVSGVDAKLVDQSNCILEIQNSITEIDLLVNRISNAMGEDFFKRVSADLEQRGIITTEIKTIEKKILHQVEEISLYVKDEENCTAIELLKKDLELVSNLSVVVDKLYTFVMKIDMQKQNKQIQQIVEVTGNNSQILSELNASFSVLSQIAKALDDIKNDIMSIYTVLDNGFERCSKEETLQEIVKLKNTVKYMFLVNGITVVGIIGVLLVLLFR